MTFKAPQNQYSQVTYCQSTMQAVVANDDNMLEILVLFSSCLSGLEELWCVLLLRAGDVCLIMLLRLAWNDEHRVRSYCRCCQRLARGPGNSEKRTVSFLSSPLPACTEQGSAMAPAAPFCQVL